MRVRLWAPCPAQGKAIAVPQGTDRQIAGASAFRSDATHVAVGRCRQRVRATGYVFDWRTIVLSARGDNAGRVAALARPHTIAYDPRLWRVYDSDDGDTHV